MMEEDVELYGVIAKRDLIDKARPHRGAFGTARDMYWLLNPFVIRFRSITMRT